MNTSFFAGNRERLLTSIGRGALIVLTAYQEVQRSYDSAHFFEQESNFWYLSGIEAADWWLIIDGKHHKSYAVAPVTSGMKQIFDGSLSFEAAKRISGVDEVISRDAADSLLLRLKLEHPLVYTINESTHMKQYASFAINSAQRELSEYLKNRFKSVQSVHAEIADLRAIKQPEEIEAVQKAVDITIEGFQNVRKELGSYSYEYEAEARLSYDFRRLGAKCHAYSPIVGAGENACTLHYVDNDVKLTKKSLLLIDAGAQYHRYAADITRTYAIGQPTKRQIAVYEAVKNVHSACIALCKPGTNLSDLQESAEELMTSSLRELGLLRDNKIVRDYFPHAIGHGLGIDVHDSLGNYTELQENMIITIEPGIYIRDESIGVRIEDDILITSTGHRNMSLSLSTEL